MPFINGLLKKKGLGQLVNYCYLRFGLETTVQMLDEVKELGFLYATKAGISIGIDDMVIPDEQAGAGARRREAGGRRAAAVPGRRHHQRRALQQGHRDLVGHHRESLRRNVRGDGACRQVRRHQPDLHHGRLRRPRIETADPPALRHARPDGQALRRDHRDPHHRQLPRRADRAAVLHLHARRPQGTGGHGAEDGRLRLPDPPPGGRGPGRDRQRGRLRHGGRHLRRLHRRSRARSSSRCATASWAACRWRRSRTTKAT